MTALEEAVQEIERLKAEIENMRTYSHETVRGLVDWRDKEITSLKAENRTLRYLIYPDGPEKYFDDLLDNIDKQKLKAELMDARVRGNAFRDVAEKLKIENELFRNALIEITGLEDFGCEAADTAREALNAEQ